MSDFFYIGVDELSCVFFLAHPAVIYLGTSMENPDLSGAVWIIRGFKKIVHNLCACREVLDRTGYETLLLSLEAY